ncbi:MAG: 2'-5' RNA ligase family protein [Candidatus Angelobacter sp.]
MGIDAIHLTIQGIGFTDEVSRVDIKGIVASALPRCAQLEPIKASVDEPRIDEEAVHMNVHPVEQISRVKMALRNGIEDVWGRENIPETMDDFRPHITLAYSNGVVPIERIDAAIKKCRLPVVELLISSVSLIDLNRDHGRYAWTEVATVRLGQRRATHVGGNDARW